MPDGDVVSSSIHHRWRSAYAGLKGTATPHEVAPRVLKALTETLRANGGVGGLHGYGVVVEACVAGKLTAAEARTNARLVAQSQEQTPFALIVHKAVDRCLVAPISETAVLAPGVLTVVDAICIVVMDHALFGRVRPALVGERFPNHEAYDDFVADCRALLAPALEHLGKSLSRDPSAARLRAAPMRRRAHRSSTAAILNTSIL